MKIFSSLVTVFLLAACGPNVSTLKSYRDQSPEKSYRSTRWLDGRPKLIVDPQNQPMGLTHDNLARAWIQQEAGRLHVSPKLEALRLESTRQSAHGIHYTFVTPDGSGSVKNSVLIVSVTKDGSKIYRAYNALDPSTTPDSPIEEAKITRQQAIHAAWAHLKVTGKLLSEPKAERIKDIVGGVRKQWWIVNLETTQPAGSWQYWIDPQTGRVVKHVDRRIYHVGLEEARADLHKRTSSKNNSFLESSPTSGRARLFKVDPRSAITDPSIVDGSPSEQFEPAYEDAVLDGIAKTPRGYELISRRVSLQDWDSPFSGISISADGAWGAKRGENAFNDTMTWWHLDQSIRNLEALGYRDENRIFRGALVADPDGFDGQDNSFFTPTINALSFGHGCVDDNEDPDVILHEMGHAINAAINPYWQDGDTGAMGEGFGDYWAVSYGYSDERNKAVDRFRVFNWDGSSGCWDGRRTDRSDARYKRGTQYHAHDRGSDGIISDELWSTPLVMALDELVAKGINKTDVDLVIIESQFGLAHGLTMNDWANALVQTASLLFPQGPHAEVFARYFHKHLIMSAPAHELIYSNKTFTNAGKNGVPDPGETFSLNVELLNIGDLTASGVKAKLLPRSEWISALNAETTYDNIPELERAAGKTPFTLSVNPAVACGKLSMVEVELTDSNGFRKTIPLEFPLGVPGAEEDSIKTTPDLEIPDHNQAGISSSIDVQVKPDAVVREGFSVDVAIKHPSVTDLKIVLTTPKGHEIVLKSFLSGERSDRDIIGNYPTTLHPVEDFSALGGMDLNGRWSIRVVDGFEGGKGRLLGWGIRNPTGRALCER